MESAARGIVGRQPQITFDIYLGGAERGSLRLLFRAIPRGEPGAIRDLVSLTSELLTIFTAIITIGLESGVLKPVAPAAAAGTSLKIELPKEQKNEIFDYLEQIRALSTHAGFDHVEISMPSTETCSFSGEGSMSSGLIGSLRDVGASVPFGRNLVATVRVGSPTLHARINTAEPTELLIGNVTFDDAPPSQFYPVLISWASKRSPPTPMEPVRVRFDLLPIDDVSLRPVEAVPIEARTIQGIAFVHRVVIEE